MQISEGSLAKQTLKKSLKYLWDSWKNTREAFKEGLKSSQPGVKASTQSNLIDNLKRFNNPPYVYPRPIQAEIFYCLKRVPAWAIVGTPSLQYLWSTKAKQLRFSRRKKATKYYNLYLRGPRFRRNYRRQFGRYSKRYRRYRRYYRRQRYGRRRYTRRYRRY